MEDQSQEQPSAQPKGQQGGYSDMQAGVFMSDSSQRGSKKERSLQLIFGILIVLLGVAFLSDNFGFVEIGSVWHYWPLIFVAIGLNKMFQAQTPHERESGIWWMFWGLWFLVSYQHLFGLSFRTSWPLIIIAWGIHILWKSYYRNSRNYFVKEQHDGN